MEWRDIKGYEGLYQVSDTGLIKSLARYKPNHSKLQYIPEKIKTERVKEQGYSIIDLYKDNKGKTYHVHRLVAEAFVPNPYNKETVNHIDGNKRNNIATNLEWATAKEQNVHFYKHHLKSKSNIKKAVLAMNMANAKKVMCLNSGKIFNSIAEAARCFNIDGSTISAACKGRLKYAGKDKNDNLLKWTYA